MGSRRRRHAALVAATLAGCTVGAPPGFSSGEAWTVPLVGPIEDGVLIVPVKVGGAGPFLFALDPDANVSMVDEDVVKAAKLRTGVGGPHLLDESDTEQPAVYAEVLDWQLGTLAVHRTSQASAVVVKAGAFDRDGRRIHGVIGRDLIADSLVFGFDRDQGVIVLSTRKAFHPPAGATALRYEPLLSRIENVDVVPVPRRLARATIGDRQLAMHLDLGRVASQLRASTWGPARLQVTEPDQAASAAAVSVGGVTAPDVAFVPYRDQRWEAQDLDGTLGLGFFRHHAVFADWDDRTYYVRPRGDVAATTAARIGRWQSGALARCPHPGCATVSMVDPLAGKPPDQVPAQHPGVVVSVVRDPGAPAGDLEVLVAVTPAAGKPAPKWLVANLPAGVVRAMTHLPGDYVGTSFAVVDASPFPRPCPADGGCIDFVQPPR